MSAKNFGDPPGDLNCFAIAVDVGWTDADAIGVLGWNDRRPDLWLVEEDVTAEQVDTDLEAKILFLRDKYARMSVDPVPVIGDHGGGGKKTLESINKRNKHGLYIQPAQKNPGDKMAAAELLRLDVKKGFFHCRPDSKFADEAAVLEWAYNSAGHKVFPDNVRKLGRHFDMTHVVLYGMQKARHFRAVPVVPPKLEAELDREREAEEAEQAARSQSQDWWEQDAEEMGYE